jgi:hypothetical protein
MKNTFHKIKNKVFVASSLIGASIGTASADIVTDAQTALAGAQADATTVGGYVLLAVAAVVAVTIILGLVRKV